MSMFFARPQFIEKIALTIGDIYHRPQDLFPGVDPSPGVDTEIIEEVQNVFDALVYDQGDDSGFVRVEE